MKSLENSPRSKFDQARSRTVYAASRPIRSVSKRALGENTGVASLGPAQKARGCILCPAGHARVYSPSARATSVSLSRMLGELELTGPFAWVDRARVVAGSDHARGWLGALGEWPRSCRLPQRMREQSRARPSALHGNIPFMPVVPALARRPFPGAKRVPGHTESLPLAGVPAVDITGITGITGITRQPRAREPASSIQ